MAQPIPPPSPQTLLPPLLACLPTAFASTRPPPALLPLLSPILRQRVQLLSDSASSPSDSWLLKLTWNRTRAEELPAVIESEAFELHPVSNEIEFDDAHIAGYRRLDVETLHARIDVGDLRLTVIYLWCVGDTEGGGDGWRVGEVLPLNRDGDTTSDWKTSIEEADETTRQKSVTNTPAQGVVNGDPAVEPNGISSNAVVDGADDDDDYWAQYDNAPTSTPGPQPSPAPPADTRAPRHGRTMSDADYYSQYAQVQPDMDNDDPSADRNAIGEFSLNGDTIAPTSQPAPSQPDSHPDSSTKSPAPILSQPTTEHPRPQTGSSDDGSSSAIVDRLEDSASMQSQTELAVRQHVASTIKSLHRLARSTGIGTAEFEGMIKTEMEMLRFEEGMEES
ncbi:MAG: hypothetical protein Q9208_008199 [Pyrenodesmia sp. 3 TL-2023]